MLYGGWRGFGSDPDLVPETGAGREFTLGYDGARFSGWISTYAFNTENAFSETAGALSNAGGSQARGVDAYGEWRYAPEGLGPLRLWLAYSYIDTEEERPGVATPNDRGEVGDVAPHKLQFGLVVEPAADWSLSLRSRALAARDTFYRNPVRRVPGYASFDLNLDYAPKRGLGMALGIYNLFDRAHVHPGVRQADAGDTPGFFDGDGIWHGRRGFFSSLLPQEGRVLLAGLSYRY